MNKIDVSYRYSPKVLKGGKMLMDPDTGIETLVGPEDTTVYPTTYTLSMIMDMEDKAEAEAALKNNPEPLVPATADAGIAKAAFGLSIEAENKFEDEAKPTKPAKHGRHKAHEGDK